MSRPTGDDHHMARNCPHRVTGDVQWRETGENNMIPIKTVDGYASRELLISEVQGRTSLWNDRHPDYKKTEKTNKLWDEIGAVVGYSGSLCTDGAPSMLGKSSGFTALIKKEIPDIIITHCFLHRHALASKTLPTNLKEIMTTAVKVVNFIRARVLHHRLFKVLCQEMGSEHEFLLYYTEVRWLSRGQVMKRLYELREEISYFLIERQRKEVTIMDASEKINAFVSKISLWKRRLQSENLPNFPTLEQELSKNNIALSSSMKAQICEHLDVLENSFGNYFDFTFSKSEIWLRNPFLVDLNTIDDSDLVKDELIDLKSKEMARHDFQTKNLIEFWYSLTMAYPRAVSTAMKFLIPFATSVGKNPDLPKFENPDS
ncbi:hypothetical protein QTP88_020082 [Uroleucon formosanum]